MNVKFQTYHSLPCEAREFFINGIPAETDDFGEEFDEGDRNACEDRDIARWGCVDYVFKRRPCSEMVLNRYKISEEEYSEICDLLEAKLSIGMCGWCV